MFGNTADNARKLWHSSIMAAATAPDLSALDIDALRAIVLQQHVLIERLQTMIAHLRRMQFGWKSEKIDRQVEQLELELEELESGKAAQLEELERKLESATVGLLRIIEGNLQVLTEPYHSRLSDQLSHDIGIALVHAVDIVLGISDR
jgi:hypothetical protein